MTQLAVIVPTFNESQNLPVLLERLVSVIQEDKLDAQILVIDDDSQDGTAEIGRSFASRAEPRHPITVIVRKHEKGLSSAVIEGFAQADADVLLVCDADLSHPVEAIPALLRPILDGKADMAIGSRNIPGGKTVGWPWHRKLASKTAAWLAKPLTPVRDPMSGFFAVRRDVLKRGSLAPIGYKIALEILVKCQIDKVVEVPITFTERQMGSSKFGVKEVWNYLRHLHRLHDSLRPLWMEFFRFAFVGGLGFLVDFFTFNFGLFTLGLPYQIAQAGSFVVAVTHNFIWNKFWTFRNARHHSLTGQYFSYVAVAGLALGIRSLFLWWTVEQLGAEIHLAFILAVLLTVAVNFVGSRWIVFRRDVVGSNNS